MLVTYRADGWKYQQVPRGGSPGFEAVGYDDSSFSTGGAPFGTSHAGCPLGPQVRTFWGTDSDLLLRRSVNISVPLATSLAVTVTVDNDVAVYWNGALIAAPPPKEGCAGYDDYQFEIPTSEQFNENTLAVRAIDRARTFSSSDLAEPNGVRMQQVRRCPP